MFVCMMHACILQHVRTFFLWHGPFRAFNTQYFHRLMGDLNNTVKQRAAGRMESARIAFKDLLQTPEFIFEETSHAADLQKTVLVLDNLEERDFFPLTSPNILNLGHMRMVVKTVAKFHAVSLTYKQMLFTTLLTQSAKDKASRQIDEVVMEGDQNRVLTGRRGLFARFPFLAQRKTTMAYLMANRDSFLDMFATFLKCFEREKHLSDVFDYIRFSADAILQVGQDQDNDEDDEGEVEEISCADDNPLDAIVLGILEARSFLFKYEDDEDKENDKKKKNAKLQRSQSERIKERSASADMRQRTRSKNAAPNNAKCPKLEPHKGMNKFLQNVIGKSKDDAKVPLTTRRASRAPKPRDPNQSPKSVALVNAKYVTYGRVTRDLAVLFFTSASALIR